MFSWLCIVQLRERNSAEYNTEYITQPGIFPQVGTRWHKSLNTRMMMTQDCSPLALAFTKDRISQQTTTKTFFSKTCIAWYSFVMCLPETILRDGEQPGIPNISSYSGHQEGPFHPHLRYITWAQSYMLNTKTWKLLWYTEMTNN